MAMVDSDGDGCLIRLKVVPGSSRDGIAGVLGDRLKVKVAAAPEAGKANKAVCELLARELGVRARDIAIVSGQASPEKTIRVRGLEPAAVRKMLKK